jgi:hypothetical protein
MDIKYGGVCKIVNNSIKKKHTFRLVLHWFHLFMHILVSATASVKCICFCTVPAVWCQRRVSFLGPLHFWICLLHHHIGFILLSLCHLLERGHCLSHSNAGATPVLYLEGSLYYLLYCLAESRGGTISMWLLAGNPGEMNFLIGKLSNSHW